MAGVPAFLSPYAPPSGPGNSAPNGVDQPGKVGANPIANMNYLGINYPTLQSIFNPSDPNNPNASPTLQSQYTQQASPDINYNANMAGLQPKLDAIQLNKQPLKNLEDYAGAQGNSPWANLMLQSEDTQHLQANDDAARAAAAGAGATNNALATRGGLTQGARERVAQGNNLNEMMGEQNVNRQSVLNRLGIQTTDQANKLDVAKMLPGAEVQALQPDIQKTNIWSSMANADSQGLFNAANANRNYDTGVSEFNIGNSIGGIKDLNANNLSRYNSDMQGKAAEINAQAMKESGK